jgi:phage minor structural protein
MFYIGDFDLDGNGNLTNVYTINPLNANIHPEQNGEKTLTMTLDIEYKSLIKGYKLIQYKESGDKNNDIFRIINYTKNNKVINITAKNLFSDTKNYLIVGTANYNGKTLQEILNNLNTRLNNSGGSPFTFTSNISGTIPNVSFSLRSLFDCLLELADKFGGYIFTNGYSITFESMPDANNPDMTLNEQINYGANLEKIEVEYNYDDYLNRILPIGQDDVRLNKVDSSQSIYLSADHPTRPPVTKTIQFEQSFNREDYPSGTSGDTAYWTDIVADLRRQAQKYLDRYSAPQVNYTLSAELESQIVIGNKIKVNDSQLGVEIDTYITAYDYNPLTKRYTNIEFGTYKPKLNSLIRYIEKKQKKKVSM